MSNLKQAVESDLKMRQVSPEVIASLDKKKCAKCDKIKNVNEFNKDKSSPDGFHSYCKKCRKFYRKNKDLFNKHKRIPKLINKLLGYKKCTTCKEIKNHTKFSLSGNDKYEYKSSCSECRNKKQRERYYKKKYGKSHLKIKIKRILSCVLDFKNEKKRCTKCGEYKSFDEYHKQKNGRYGLKGYCADCTSDYYYENREQILERKKQYREENPEYHKIYHKKWYKENREKKLKQNKKWRKENYEKWREYQNNYNKERRENDIGFKIRCNLSNRIYGALKNNRKSKETQELLGTSIEQFKDYLEDQFEEGMTWDNYGIDGWHIDHIVPCAYFDLSKPHHQEECFFYTNLQPLWVEDNLKKSDKLNYE